jgi:threonyl-tRNA synthetase
MSKQNELNEVRHTAAHVLAAASQQLRPETHLGIGPATDEGFFHDVEVDKNYSEDDLKKLQKKMEQIKKMNLPIVQREVSKEEAKKLFKDDPYKLELIDEVEGDMVGVSDMGDGFFVTLCEGGHAESTNKIGYFMLTHLSGVYWRGDESKPQLQRIFGVSFPTKDELVDYLAMLEEAKKRDHRKLGKKLDLFTFSPLVGPGLPIFTPRGTFIFNELVNYIQSLQEPLGYERVRIPHIAKSALYKTSGHWDKFQDDLFHVKGQGSSKFAMKPMNCPHHTQVFAGKMRSYKELPLRISEVTTCYRDEQVGELQGLLRLRSFTQDDAHVFCTPEQAPNEIDGLIDLVQTFYNTFDMKLLVHLSLRDPKEPKKYLGTDKEWKESETILRDVLKGKKVDFVEDKGEAAFYGPKIDFVAQDGLKRKWQLATIQLDLNMPGRFKLKYTDKKGREKTPVMVHRAVLGAVERFMAILIEHYAGALPLWLSPTQVSVLPISDDQVNYAKSVAKELREAGVRVEVDERSESIGKKIREAEIMKVPVMLIVGKKEVEDNTVAVRSKANGDDGAKNIETAVKEIAEDIKNKK